MSAHHYFRDLLLLRQRHDSLAAGYRADVPQRQKLSELVGERVAMYPCSGEIQPQGGRFRSSAG